MNKLEKEFYEVENFFFRSISQEWLALEEKTATAYSTGVHSEHLNMVIQQSALKDPTLTFQKADLFFRHQDVPWTWIVKEAVCDESLSHALGKAQFSFSETLVAMEYTLPIRQEFPASPHLKIVVCTDDLKDWSIPLQEAFEATSTITHEYVDAHARPSRGVYHFTGFLDARPVTSLTLSICQQFARIDDVGTIPSHQRKGYGTEIILHALIHAQALGAKTCFLGASQMGLGLYQKIGFRSLFLMNIFGRSS